MKIIDLTDMIAQYNILTGRSALAYRQFGCSSDPGVIMTSYSGNVDIYSDPRWLIPKEDFFESEIYEGIEIATLNQSFYDALKYLYDDTILDELLDNMKDNEFDDFLNWIRTNNIINEAINIFIGAFNYEGLRTELDNSKDYKNPLLITAENMSTIKMDIEFESGEDIELSSNDLNKSLKDKLELVMLKSDRQFTHLVDVIISLYSEYPDGVLKKELLEMTNNINLHIIDLETQLDHAAKFMPTLINGLTLQDHAIIFDTLMTGLLSDKIDKNSLFRNGIWYYMK